ncbi:MAG TPA: hypothetical protein VM574_02010 [Terrimicrobiaceae bacterium]|nr:hypothetical protein [Terrimicrobiaceae bacterium]
MNTKVSFNLQVAHSDSTSSIDNADLQVLVAEYERAVRQRAHLFLTHPEALERCHLTGNVFFGYQPATAQAWFAS